MQTIFSHIVQKRFSQQYEDVATDALAFILHSSESARNGMTKLLRNIVPNLPELRFRTQQVEGRNRPDMWGYDEREPHVYIENKFWAGLTDNQPVSYLKKLVEYKQPTLLLIVTPEMRMQTLWRELSRRLKDGGISVTMTSSASDKVLSCSTNIGPALALTSWPMVLSALELEAADDLAAKSNLLQLRALCEAADCDAFTPIRAVQVSDQETPAFILQLSSIVQAAVDLAVTERILSVGNLRPQAGWNRVGRYVRLADEKGVGFWIGIHFPLWKTHGSTPIWLIFSSSDFGRANEVQPILDPWAIKERIFTTLQNDEYAVAVDIALGEDKGQVVNCIVDRLKVIASLLSELKQKG